MTLEIPRHSEVKEGRKPFAHYLWNAGVDTADPIESSSNDDQKELVTETALWDNNY